jgi:broad specificity phosphatase PhoE
MKRTMETASIIRECLNLGDQLIPVFEEIRERTGLHRCDKRSTLEGLRAHFGEGANFDYTPCVSNEDPIFENDRRETFLSVLNRGYHFLSTHIWESKSNATIVVSHSSFLIGLFNGVLLVPENDPSLSGAFSTAEIRAVVLKFDK